MSKRRVVITGLGIVSPLGIGVEENWLGIRTGKNGIGAITQFDATGFPSTIAGEVRNFDPTKFLTEKDMQRFFKRKGCLFILATQILQKSKII